jgi:hypothetical protein
MNKCDCPLRIGDESIQVLLLTQFWIGETIDSDLPTIQSMRGILCGGSPSATFCYNFSG